MTAADSGVLFDPSDVDTVTSPYPVYDQLRCDDPVHWNPKGFWFLSRYSDVQACLNDPRFSNRPAPFALVHARNKNRFAAADVANNLIAFKDAPEHPKLRGWVARCFARHSLGKDDILRDLADEYCQPLVQDTTFDLVGDFAIPFAACSICRVLGLPEQDAQQIANWSDDFFKLFHAIPNADEFNRLNDSLLDFRSYVVQVIRQRQKAQQDDFISELVATAPDGIQERDIADNIMLLAADGVGNVQSGIANCVSVICQQPDVPPELFGTSKERACLIDECLRLESPGQYQGRITTEAVEIGGRTIRAKSIVLLGLAAANRDPAAYAAPQSFDPKRTRPQHMAFGHGAHMCMGNVLVRREISAALLGLFDRNCKLRPARPEPDWLMRPGHRWMRSFDLVTESV